MSRLAHDSSRFLTVTSAWHERYPGAVFGVLVLEGAHNSPERPELAAAREELQRSLRERYGPLERKGLRALHPLSAYDAYYRRFGQTYHVLRQLESVVHKGRDLRSTGALLEAMFLAELESLLLTAAHDLDQVEGEVRLGIGTGEEGYRLLNRDEQMIKPGDMCLTDERGPIGSIILGPDDRTCLRPQTERVFFAVYGPPGVTENDVRTHLESLRRLVLLGCPEARTLHLEVHLAG